ncbi:H-NS family nucleoid-associated regulatory protein [Leptothrix discophora]|uniref:H-NS family nucleoid-associated regulatory protein n=1 Tax=Leptothrix discophora TaxID=89 RepID=A0ABT9G295_LEPDI|nr:H-NS family nucleoid-associated regulatory protein [Leptothrix discophora]MDP4300609.1 H-NS family nucleoid-associated regulatory protein [Leptothrix discophora]
MQDDDADLEKQAAIRKIRRLMEFWKIEPDELDGDIVPIAPVVRRRSAPEVRYRHPISGESWDGVGSQPDWLRRALIREGYTVDELRCAPAPGQPADTLSDSGPASS